MTTRTTSRRRLLAASAASAAGAAGVAGLAMAGSAAATPTPAAARWRGPKGGSGVRLRWLGNNGWELTMATSKGTRVVLIDPWLTRFRTGTYTAKGADPNTPLRVDTALIDGYALKADHILVTHGHYDHLTDVPYLASTTGATVLGTETHVNLMRALGAPAAPLSVVRGGEYLECDGYTIQVVRSLHSMTGPRSQVPFPGTRPGAVGPKPTVISDLVEGETLAYLVTADTGFGVLDFGGANYSTLDLAGLRPDAVMIPAGGGSVHHYVPRLLDVLGHPRYVLPTHWDDFDYPLSEPARDWGGLSALRDAVHAAEPAGRFVTLDHLETFTA